MVTPSSGLNPASTILKTRSSWMYRINTFYWICIMKMYCLPVYTVFNQIIVTLGLRTTSKRFMILEKKIQNYWSFLIKITSDFIPKKIVSGHFYETRSEIWFEILVGSVVPTKLVQFLVRTKLVRSVGRRFGSYFPYRVGKQQKWKQGLGGPEKGRFVLMNIFDYSSVFELLDFWSFNNSSVQLVK